jgi:DNA-binding NtrC family response regulator
VTREPRRKLPHQFVGDSDAAARVRSTIERVARVDATVLILGESGVGKGLAAREIHARSDRSGGPFVPVNCAAIPDTLIESELFGYEAGAFTDARGARRGAFEMADGGTLFLDEVGDLSLIAQPKILRAMETRVIQRVGGEAETPVDIRILAATNQDLQRKVRDGSFREELYYRLRILEVRVPPLRERLEDVPILAARFTEQIAQTSGRPFAGISETAMRALRGYTWPGNVRELRSTLERAMAMTSGGVLGPDDISLEGPTSDRFTGRDELLDQEFFAAREQFERTYVVRLLARHGGSVSRAARAAGLATRSLYKILHRLGLMP